MSLSKVIYKVDYSVYDGGLAGVRAAIPRRMAGNRLGVTGVGAGSGFGTTKYTKYTKRVGGWDFERRCLRHTQIKQIPMWRGLLRPRTLLRPCFARLLTSFVGEPDCFATGASRGSLRSGNPTPSARAHSDARFTGYDTTGICHHCTAVGRPNHWRSEANANCGVGVVFRAVVDTLAFAFSLRMAAGHLRSIIIGCSRGRLPLAPPRATAPPPVLCTTEALDTCAGMND